MLVALPYFNQMGYNKLNFGRRKWFAMMAMAPVLPQVSSKNYEFPDSFKFKKASYITFRSCGFVAGQTSFEVRTYPSNKTPTTHFSFK